MWKKRKRKILSRHKLKGRENKRYKKREKKIINKTGLIDIKKHKEEIMKEEESLEGKKNELIKLI